MSLPNNHDLAPQRAGSVRHIPGDDATLICFEVSGATSAYMHHHLERWKNQIFNALLVLNVRSVTVTIADQPTLRIAIENLGLVTVREAQQIITDRLNGFFAAHPPQPS